MQGSQVIQVNFNRVLFRICLRKLVACQRKFVDCLRKFFEPTGRHFLGQGSSRVLLRATGAPTKLLASSSRRLEGHGWLLAKRSQW